MREDLVMEFTLPSRGKLYPNLPEGKVYLHPIMGEHEELLAEEEGSEHNASYMMRQVTSRLIGFPQDSGFHFNDLLVTDWYACILQIFGHTYSNEMHLTPTCTHCGHHHENGVTKNIGELEETTPEDIRLSKDEEYNEPFTTVLPKSKQKVQFKLLRLRDEERRENFTAGLKKKRETRVRGKIIQYSLAQHIVAIDDNSNFTELKLLHWVRNNISGDNMYLRQYFKQRETGYDLVPSFNCEKCGKGFKVALPINQATFFRSMAPELGGDSPEQI